MTVKDFKNKVKTAVENMTTYDNVIRLTNLKNELTKKHSKLANNIPSQTILTCNLLHKDITSNERFNAIVGLTNSIISLINMAPIDLINDDFISIKPLNANQTKALENQLLNEELKDDNDDEPFEYFDMEPSKDNDMKPSKDYKKEIDSLFKIINLHTNSFVESIKISDLILCSFNEALEPDFIKNDVINDDINQLQKSLASQNSKTELVMYVSNLYIKNSIKFIMNKALSIEDKLDMRRYAFETIHHINFKNMIISTIETQIVRHGLNML